MRPGRPKGKHDVTTRREVCKIVTSADGGERHCNRPGTACDRSGHLPPRPQCEDLHAARLDQRGAQGGRQPVSQGSQNASLTTMGGRDLHSDRTWLTSCQILEYGRHLGPRYNVKGASSGIVTNETHKSSVPMLGLERVAKLKGHALYSAGLRVVQCVLRTGLRHQSRKSPSHSHLATHDGPVLRFACGGVCARTAGEVDHRAHTPDDFVRLDVVVAAPNIQLERRIFCHCRSTCSDGRAGAVALGVKGQATGAMRARPRAADRGTARHRTEPTVRQRSSGDARAPVGQHVRERLLPRNGRCPAEQPVRQTAVAARARISEPRIRDVSVASSARRPARSSNSRRMSPIRRGTPEAMFRTASGSQVRITVQTGDIGAANIAHVEEVAHAVEPAYLQRGGLAACLDQGGLPGKSRQHERVGLAGSGMVEQAQTHDTAARRSPLPPAPDRRRPSSRRSRSSAPAAQSRPAAGRSANDLP